LLISHALLNFAIGRCLQHLPPLNHAALNKNSRYLPTFASGLLGKFLPLGGDRSDFSPDDVYKYLGKTGDFIFFLSKDHVRVLIFRNEKIDHLTLFHFERHDMFRFMRIDNRGFSERN
ncbi:MAG: hypothetical protein WBK91_04170, partial [Alphaproteobacteria bacterium]